MRSIDMLRANLDALSLRDPGLASELTHVRPSEFYSALRLAREGSPVPLFRTGSPAHSLYDPLKEAARTVDTLPPDSFPVFLGLGGGYSVRSFLERRPGASCAAVELDPESLVSLLSLIDLSDLLSHPRFTLVPALNESQIRSSLIKRYLPALHGGLIIVPPSIHWLSPSDSRRSELEEWISGTVKTISADFSVQAHFGRLWTRNFWLNMRRASAGQPLPPVDASKTALIAAAGPSLEDWIPKILINRSSYSIIATDTAYGTLTAYGIVPEYFVSIDAQRVSSMHGRGTFVPGTCVILELCGNPTLARLAERSHCPLFYVAGEHPLPLLAANRFGFPRIKTGSGTVTMAAREIAHLLGYSRVEFAGADFRYTGGKPYARGTYLADLYGHDSRRLKPGESWYTALMFRAPTRAVPNESTGLDYRSDVLDSYAASFRNWSPAPSSEFAPVAPFDFSGFKVGYLRDLKKRDFGSLSESPLFVTLLPFIAWYRRRFGTYSADAIQLALRLIEGYTDTQ